jgi:hypothetical protein
VSAGIAPEASSTSSVHDFDFLMGTWHMHNRRLRERLAGCDEWDEFEATSVARPLLDGLGNMDEVRTDYDGGMVAVSIRFFDPVTRLWAIYWASNRTVLGLLEQPVVGSFEDGVGTFDCDDTFAGRPIIVRYRWWDVDTPHPRWAQFFSEDGGETWEKNYENVLTRTGGLS